MKDKLATHCSYMTTYRMYKGRERELRGGRDLPEQFTLQTFCDWIRHELEADLDRRWEIKMNGVGVADACASTAGWQPARVARELSAASLRNRFTTVLSAVPGQFRPMLRFTELPFRD